jgi:hypothetical protein
MNKNDVALLVGVILIKIATGMAMGLFGPMLPSLAKSTRVTIAQAGWLFATRSFAIFTGGCVTGLFERHFNQVVFLLISAIVQMCSLYYIPQVTNFGLLLFLVFNVGCVIGMVDVGGQSIILKKFKRDSTQLIQLFHFVFNCGAILGNTIVGAYIEPAAETPCKGVIQMDDPLMLRNSTNSTLLTGRTALIEAPQTRGVIKDDFSVVFRLPAALTIVPVSVFALLWISSGIKKLTKKEPLKKKEKEEEVVVEEEEEKEEPKQPWSEVRLFVMILTIVLFCNTSTQQVWGAFIYEFSRCSPDIKLSSESAAGVVNIYWVTSTIARGTAIIISRITSPKKYIVFDYGLAVFALALLSIRPLLSHLVLVIAVIAFGFSIATLYANVIIYTVSVFNVENGYMYVFYIGAQLLPTFNPVLCGLWMGSEINGFVYFQFLTMFISALSLPFLFKTGQALIEAKQAEINHESATTEEQQSIRPIPVQLARITEVERVVQVSTSVNSIALSIVSNKTFTSGHTVDDDIVSC